MSLINATVKCKDCPSKEIALIKVTTDKPVKYKAGQFVTIQAEDFEARSYSVANAPEGGQSSHLEFHIGQGHALSKYIVQDLDAGESLKVSHGQGNITFKSVCKKPLLMVAGGTGLAQIKALIEAALQKERDNPIYLYHGSRNKDGLYLHAHFKQLEIENPLFTYRFALSEENHKDFPHGLITQLIEQDFEDLKNYRSYMCGPVPMVEATKTLLLKKSIDPQRIHAEDWSL